MTQIEEDLLEMATLTAKGACLTGPEAVRELADLLAAFALKHKQLLEQRLGRGFSRN